MLRSQSGRTSLVTARRSRRRSSTDGRPEKYECLRALGFRQRGLYATKDTFVTLALATERDDIMLWLVRQTGVQIETLRRHYEKWIPKPDRRVWTRIDPSLSEPRRRLKVVG